MTDMERQVAAPAQSSGVSRRKFLGGIALAVAGSSALAVVGGSALAMVQEQQLLGATPTLAELLATLQRSTFDRYRGDSFRFRSSAGDVALRLADVRDLATTRTLSAEEREGSFSVVFRGSLAQELGQGTYTVVHHRIGTFDLFIVPQKATADGHSYEAVFNRVVM